MEAIQQYASMKPFHQPTSIPTRVITSTRRKQGPESMSGPPAEAHLAGNLENIYSPLLDDLLRHADLRMQVPGGFHENLMQNLGYYYFPRTEEQFQKAYPIKPIAIRLTPPYLQSEVTGHIHSTKSSIHSSKPYDKPLNLCTKPKVVPNNNVPNKPTTLHHHHLHEPSTFNPNSPFKSPRSSPPTCDDITLSAKSSKINLGHVIDKIFLNAFTEVTHDGEN